MFVLIWIFMTPTLGAATSGTTWFDSPIACQRAADEIAKVGGVAFCVEDETPGVDG